MPMPNGRLKDMNGYIKFFRKFWDNPNTGNPAWISTWLYLLCHATRKPYRMRMDGDYRTLEPGQLICSARRIAEHIGVSRDRVRRILNDMIEDEMLRRDRYNKKSVYTVLNWANYQHEYVTDETGNEAMGTAMNDATNKKKEDRRNDIYNADSEKASREKAKDETLTKARGVMREFNQRAGKIFRDHASSDHLKHIRARLEDGFTVEEMIEVIDHKVKELKGTEDECKWLNPTTLFRPQNFERNLDWARNADNIEIARLTKEFRKYEQSNPAEAADIENKLRKLKQKRNGEPQGFRIREHRH